MMLVVYSPRTLHLNAEIVDFCFFNNVNFVLLKVFVLFFHRSIQFNKFINKLFFFVKVIIIVKYNYILLAESITEERIGTYLEFFLSYLSCCV